MSTPHLEIVTLRRENEELREWVARLQKTSQTLTCVYCGKEYPPGSPTHGSSVLTEHIKVCEKHPLRAAEAALRECQQELGAAKGHIAMVQRHHEENLESDSIVASCGCTTKTNEVHFHKPGCKYRLICERDDARKELAEANGYLKTRVIVGLGGGRFAAVDPWVKKEIETMQAKIASIPS